MSVMGDGGGFAGQFASGGRRLLVGCTDGTCRVWDFAADTTTVLTSTKWLVRDLATARVGDATVLASIQGDGELRVRKHEDRGEAAPGWATVVSRNVGGSSVARPFGPVTTNWLRGSTGVSQTTSRRAIVPSS